MRLTNRVGIRSVAEVTLVETVEGALLNDCGVETNERLLLAVSGGVDSMVMLELVFRLARIHHWDLTLAHFNHALRGPESEGDEAFIREVADRLGLFLVVGRAQVGEIEGVKGQSLEMAARTGRHEFLANTAREQRISKVILAHHAGDQTELFLLRLFRGAGSSGMGGMKRASPSPVAAGIELIRPLLGLSKSRILAFARSEGVAYREDSSNADTDILRNQIRKELIPLIERNYSRSFAEAVTRTMDLLGAEHDWVAESAQEWMDEEPQRTPFSGLAKALQREVLRRGLLRVGLTPEFDLIERLRVESADSIVMVDGGRRIARDRRGKIVEKPMFHLSHSRDVCPIELKSSEGEERFGEGVIRWEIVRGGSFDMREGSGPETEYFDADRVGSKILLRHWLPGDRFQPIGLEHQVKLQDWFTNEKVPSHERRSRVVGESANGVIFWVEGMRISEAFKLTESTKNMLKITWVRDLKN